ncbi:MAG: FAD binding domain-containing protein, partial [Variibacter sp.]|nr:FAD binding domain-containing protein [Variibacter sp.]
MRFSLHRARSVEDALALAAELDSRWRYVAGGTDLVVQMRRGARAIDDLIDLSAIAPLRGIAATDGRYRLGALCTHKDVERDAALREDFPALHAAARLVGGHQIRNVGTIGGNLGNASPAADVAVALLALDARICVQGPRGVRAIAIDDFFVGPGKTALAPAELIESIDLDCPAAGETSRFLKVGRRQAMEIAVASVAVGLRLRADGTCERARIALGAVG